MNDTKARKKSPIGSLVLALHLLSVGLAGAVAGAFGQTLLAEHGYVPSYATGLAVAGGLALTYMALQWAWWALMRLLKPAAAPGPALLDALSQGAVAAFIPALMRIEVAWPHPALERVEPLLYFAGFLALHSFLKLASFFAMLQSDPARRTPALSWLVGGCAAGIAAYLAFNFWLGALASARPIAPDETDFFRVGDAYARARVVPEGAVVEYEITPKPNLCLTMRWAPARGQDLPPGLAGGQTEAQAPPGTIHVAVVLEGRTRQRVSESIELGPAGWTQFRVPAERMPEDTRHARITWSFEKEPAWQTITGLRPMVHSARHVLLAGPLEHVEQSDDGLPNFLVVAVDGLSADHVQFLGYDRNTTPQLEQLAGVAMNFTNAFTPAPEAAAAAMTLLTGAHPLRHNILGTRHPTLPTTLKPVAEILRRDGYATAAFTEAEGATVPDLAFGTGFERGFELFDQAYHVPEAGAEPAEGQAVVITTGPARSTATLQKVRHWLEHNGNARFMAFVRLRQAAEMVPPPSGRTRFTGRGTAPAPVDIFDEAVAELDQQLGALVTYLRDSGRLRNTVVVVVGAYGLDFPRQRGAQPYVTLSEPSLHVPLLIAVPGLAAAERSELVRLEDVTPTLLRLAGRQAEGTVDGVNVLGETPDINPVSVMGDPLVLSLRTPRWRYTWESGQPAFSRRRAQSGERGVLIDLDRRGMWGADRDWSSQYPDLARLYRQRLDEWLDGYHAEWVQQDLVRDALGASQAM